MRRPEQLAHALRDLVGEYVQRTTEFPHGTVVTVTRTEVGGDGKTATVFVSVLPEERQDEVLTLLQGERYALQGAVNRAIDRHAAPQVQFALDPAPAGLDRLDRLSRGLGPRHATKRP